MKLITSCSKIKNSWLQLPSDWSHDVWTDCGLLRQSCVDIHVVQTVLWHFAFLVTIQWTDSVIALVGTTRSRRPF